jgi:uncharacterized protein YutE (UPF0331/DUF86 family)
MVSKCGFESKQEPNDYFSFSYVYRIVILVQYMHISAQYVQNSLQPIQKNVEEWKQYINMELLKNKEKQQT